MRLRFGSSHLGVARRFVIVDRITEQAFVTRATVEKACVVRVSTPTPARVLLGHTQQSDSIELRVRENNTFQFCLADQERIISLGETTLPLVNYSGIRWLNPYREVI